jgi:hypothetical protein
MASLQRIKKAIAIVSRDLTRSAYLKKMGCFLALALMLWSIGVGCVVCCASYSSDSCCVSQVDISHPSLPFVSATPKAYSEKHSCCKKPGYSQGKSVEEATSHPMDLGPCCLSDSGANGPAPLPHILRDSEISLGIAEQPVLFESGFQSLLLHTRAPVPDRGSTYLRCCVLLI